ncbi:MAG TPA: prepilin-type N-terminal cleavage/methylation domain-containing protein [Candidatus Paceibacterota bacterium]
MRILKKSQKGFTVIELLIVVSIIGLLSSIVMASLNSARIKGADAAIKTDLSGIRSSAAVEFENLNSSYNNTGSTIILTSGASNCDGATTANSILANTSIQRAVPHANAQAKKPFEYPICVIASSAYAIASPTRVGSTGNFWCVDSNGEGKAITVGTVANVVDTDTSCALLDLQ